MECSVPFIVSSIGSGEENSTDRRLIRRHVMLGKNKGKRRMKRRQVDDAVNTDIDRFGSATTSSHVPPKVGTDLSFIDFADSVELSLIGDILKFSAIAKQVVFPLGPIIAFDKKLKFEQSFQPLTYDPLYLNAMVFSTQSWYRASVARTFDNRTAHHLVKAIRLLRERLDTANLENGTSDTTINAVVMLAGHALMTGDATTARKHVLGLEKIIKMRGGLRGLKGNVKLLMEVLRCDISLSLYTGSSLIFLDACSSESWFQLQRPTPSLPIHQSLPDLSHVNDGELRRLWLEMHSFTVLVNNAASSSHRFSEEIILHTMPPFMYRLLSMTFESSGLDEAIRLGLLAFCSQVFLPWTTVKLPFNTFPKAYAECLRGLKGIQDEHLALLLWSLAIGCIVLFNGSHADETISFQLRETIVRLRVRSWDDLQRRLKEHLWIYLIFDEPGKALWDSLMAVERGTGKRLQQ